MHWNSRITLCLILLYCCVPIQSHPRGLPHVLFLLLYVAVFAYTAHTLYIAVLCTCHNNMYPDPPQRKYTQLWDIMYHITPAPLDCIYTHIWTWVRARVKRTIPFFFRLALLLPVLLACPFRFYLGPGFYEPASTIPVYYCTEFPILRNSKEFVSTSLGKKKSRPVRKCKVRLWINALMFVSNTILVLLFELFPA